MIFAFTVLTLIGLILIGVLPIWPFSRGWGYGPAVVIGIVFLMLLVMTLTGRVPGIGDTQRSMTVACSSKASLQQAKAAAGAVASEAEQHCDQLQFAAALLNQEHRAIEDDRSPPRFAGAALIGSAPTPRALIASLQRLEGG